MCYQTEFIFYLLQSRKALSVVHIFGHGKIEFGPGNVREFRFRLRVATLKNLSTSLVA